MEVLMAIPYEEGKFNLVSREGTIYARVTSPIKKYIDHDVMVREVSEAPSNMRVAVKETLNQILGVDNWVVIARIPFNGVMGFDSLLSMVKHDSAIELKPDFETNKIIRTSL